MSGGLTSLCLCYEKTAKSTRSPQLGAFLASHRWSYQVSMFQSDPLLYLHNITITGINWIGIGSIRRCWTEDMISMSIYFLTVTQSHLKIFGLSFISPLTMSTMSLCIWLSRFFRLEQALCQWRSLLHLYLMGIREFWEWSTFTGRQYTLHTLHSNAVSCTRKLRQSKPTKFILGILGLLRATLYNVPSSSLATKVPPSTCFIVPNTKLEL